MSLGFIPTFQPPLTSARFDADGCALMQFAEALDAVADEHGIQPLTSFADNREAPEDFDGDPEDLDNALGPWEDWFPAGEGLAAVSALREHFRNDSSALESPEDSEWLLAELQALETVLQAATSARAQFRLEVVS